MPNNNDRFTALVIFLFGVLPALALILLGLVIGHRS